MPLRNYIKRCHKQSSSEAGKGIAVSWVTEPDLAGQNDPQLTPWTVRVYDERGDVSSVTDRLGHGTGFGYDGYARRTSQTDAEQNTTYFALDDAGQMETLTDPDGNTTTWDYDQIGRVVTETNELSNARSFVVDGGNLVRIVDRMGRVREFGYDRFDRNTDEWWYASASAANNDPDHESPDHAFSFSYDAEGQMLSANDDTAGQESHYGYLYDGMGRVEESTINIGVPEVVLTHSYNGIGFRTGLSATIDGTEDFHNAYTPDNLGRMTRVEQIGVTGGNTVVEKRVDLSYRTDSRFDTITRYKDLDGGEPNEVVTGAYGYDLTGRLTGLTYTHHGAPPTTLRDFTWTYDAANRVTSHDSDRADENVDTFAYDDANQLTSADYADQQRADESFNYDDAGNREGTNNGDSYGTPGTCNRLTTVTTAGGTYRFDYDAEGNLTARFVDADSSGTLTSGDTDATEYAHDHRNRLTAVVHHAVFGQGADWTVS